MILNLAPSRKAIEKTPNITFCASLVSFTPLYAMITLYLCFFISLFPMSLIIITMTEIRFMQTNISFSCVCRMSHPGQGLPSALIQDMFEGGNQWTTQEGLGLNLSRKLLNRMNGQVHYVREHNKCYFLIDLELKQAKQAKEGNRQLKAG